MPNNDAMSFTAQETLTPDASANVTDGVLVEKQATRMGLMIVAEELGVVDGYYTVIIETADEDEDASGDWLENTTDSITFNVAGTYSFILTLPILDKVRARVESSGATPAAMGFTFQWLCDTELTAL